jgi:hypothetical protein
MIMAARINPSTIRKAMPVPVTTWIDRGEIGRRDISKNTASKQLRHGPRFDEADDRQVPDQKPQQQTVGSFLPGS